MRQVLRPLARRHIESPNVGLIITVEDPLRSSKVSRTNGKDEKKSFGASTAAWHMQERKRSVDASPAKVRKGCEKWAWKWRTDSKVISKAQSSSFRSELGWEILSRAA